MKANEAVTGHLSTALDNERTVVSNYTGKHLRHDQVNQVEF
jgi:hypothetical protein